MWSYTLDRLIYEVLGISYKTVIQVIVYIKYASLRYSIENSPLYYYKVKFN